MEAAVTAIPFEVTGLDFDNGSEFINHDVIDWAAGRKIFFTRARPYKKNDQATIESKNCGSPRIVEGSVMRLPRRGPLCWSRS